MALPVIVVLCLGIADGGRSFAVREDVTNATRQALRVAQLESSTTGAGATACAASGGATSATTTSHVPWQTGDPVSMKSIDSSAALESSSDGTTAGSKINGATLVMKWHCLSNAVLTNTTATSTDPTSNSSAAIEAKITYNFALITPVSAAVFGSSSPVIKADVIGRAGY